MQSSTSASKATDYIRKTYYGNDASDTDAEAVCEAFGLSTFSDAIRFSLGLVARCGQGSVQLKAPARHVRSMLDQVREARLHGAQERGSRGNLRNLRPGDQ